VGSPLIISEVGSLIILGNAVGDVGGTNSLSRWIFSVSPSLASRTGPGTVTGPQAPRAPTPHKAYPHIRIVSLGIWGLAALYVPAGISIVPAFK
jgi:hypothetical protein